jgi:quinol monooxygenase YgiN
MVVSAEGPASTHEGSPVLVSSSVLRIVQFRPRRVEVDDAMRRQFAPALRAEDGLVDVIAGRHGPDELGPRIVVSVWSSGAAAGMPDRTTTLDDLTAMLDVTDTRSERLDVRVEVHDPRDRSARLVRVFRGQVRAGELDRYVDEADAGTRADAAAGRGPIGLFLGTDPSVPDRFVTVSTWPDWATVEAATGGDVRRPIATRHPERIVAADVTHFEVIEI